MDETTQAFELPIARSQNTGSGDPLDRISVRDYTRDVEIGAFQAERGVTQRIRFNVVLEVSHHAAAETDDVDQVLSYDTITEAIDAQLTAERINLLETLAERVAERVLVNKKAVRIFVRIEKLDRIPGTLGVEIVRNRITGDAVVQKLKDHPVETAEVVAPLVVFLPNETLESDALPKWLDAVAGHELPVILCVDDPVQSLPTSGALMANRRIALLGIEQNAWVLAGKDPRCGVVNSRTELDWALKNGQLSVWAPSKIVLDAVEKPDIKNFSAENLAIWFASVFSAQALIVAGGKHQSLSGALHVSDPADIIAK